MALRRMYTIIEYYYFVFAHYCSIFTVYALHCHHLGIRYNRILMRSNGSLKLIIFCASLLYEIRYWLSINVTHERCLSYLIFSSSKPRYYYYLPDEDTPFAYDHVHICRHDYTRNIVYHDPHECQTKTPITIKFSV